MRPAESVSADGGAPLDLATLTVPRWVVSLWDGAFEGSVALHHPPTGGPSGRRSDPERSAAEAARRAATECRRYAVAHGLTRLVTLTFAEEPASLSEGWAAVEAFRRRLADHLGERVPLLVVPEWGEKRGRLHFHAAVGRFIHARDLERLWGHGFIDVRRIKAREGGARASARLAARYLAKYGAKGFADQSRRGACRRRYSTTKGTALVRRRQSFPTLADALGYLYGEAPAAVVLWSSDEADGWVAPPVALFDLDPP